MSWWEKFGYAFAGAAGVHAQERDWTMVIFYLGLMVIFTTIDSLRSLPKDGADRSQDAPPEVTQ